MRLKVFKIIVIIGCLFPSVFAQSIKVKVLDATTKKALSYVQVVKNKKQFLDFTDENGEVSILTKNSDVNISFYLLGYNTLEKKLSFKNKINEVYLEPLNENLSAVVIEVTKKADYEITRLKPVEGTHIYAGKKTEVVNLDLTQGNKSTNNARQVFSKVVGLNIYDSNDGGLQLNIGGRGLDPNRTANFNTRQNDYDISADVLGYPESYYTPPTEGLEKIQIIRGAASLQYGTQFGGLINFITKKPIKNKPIQFLTRNSVGSFGAISNFTSLTGTVNKFSYYVYYNGKKGDGFRPNSEYESNNIFGHLGYKFNKRADLSLDITSFNYLAHQPGGLSDVQFLEDPLQSYLTRNWFKVNWNLYNLKFNYSINEASKLSVSVFALNASRKAIGFRGAATNISPNVFQVNGDQINEFGEYQFRRDLLVGKFKNYGVETRFLSNYKINNQKQYLLLGAKIYKADNTSQQGAGSKNSDADFSFVEAEDYPNQNDFEYPNFNASIFGEHIINLNNKLSITPGFRFEHINTQSQGSYLNYVFNNPDSSEFVDDNNSFVRNFVLLGVGVSYKPLTNVELYANASQNYRSVTFSDIRTVNPSFIIDENITDEEGYTADVGVRGRIKKAFSYDVNIFSLLYDNRIGQVLNDRAQWVRKNIGTASIYGLESLLQWNIKESFFTENKNLKLNAFINTSITKSSYIDSEENGVEGNEVEFIPLINLKAGVDFGWKNLLTSLQYTYVDEQFTDVTNSPYNPNNSTDVNGAIPSYDILDLSISYKFSKKIKLETGVNNLLDNSYFTRRATGYPGPGIIPASPRSYYATLEIKL